MSGWVKEKTITALDTTWEWVKEHTVEGVIWIGKQIYLGSDIAILVAIVLLLFAIFGSKKAANGVYWTFATYIIIQMLGSVLK